MLYCFVLGHIIAMRSYDGVPQTRTYKQSSEYPPAVSTVHTNPLESSYVPLRGAAHALDLVVNLPMHMSQNRLPRHPHRPNLANQLPSTNNHQTAISHIVYGGF